MHGITGNSWNDRAQKNTVHLTSHTEHADAGRFSSYDIGGASNKAMEKNFRRYEKEAGGNEKIVDTDIHLNHGELAARRILPVKALGVFKDYLRTLPVVSATFTTEYPE